MTTLLLFLSHTFPKARAATAWSNHLLETIRTIRLYFARTSAPEEKTEPVFVNLLRSPGIDSQPGWPVRQPYLSYRPARLHRLAESIPLNRFLGSLNIYKYGVRFAQALCIDDRCQTLKGKISVRQMKEERKQGKGFSNRTMELTIKDGMCNCANYNSFWNVYEVLTNLKVLCSAN